MDSNFIVEFITIHQEFVIGITGAIIGSILTMINTRIRDKYKDEERYKALLKTILSELKENKKRIDETIAPLPEDIKTLFKSAKNSNAWVQGPVEIINQLSWTFPKPYSIDAWRAFVSSGLVIRLSDDIFQSLYHLYDGLQSINFAGNLSVNLFQILTSVNQLDPETNKNIDHFCKIGTLTSVFTVNDSIQETIDKIRKKYFPRKRIKPTFGG